MKLKEFQEILKADVLTENYDENTEVEIGCSSDLMSDILAFSEPGAVLITSLTNIQVINTSNMADIIAVCFVMGKDPGKNIINLAQKNDIVVFKTDYTTFESCGLLHKHGLKSSGYKHFDSYDTLII